MHAAFNVRQLTTSDVATVRALNVMFGVAFEEPETYGREIPPPDYLRRLLGRPHVIVLVALAGEEVVGGLVAYELEKLERAQSEIYLYDLAVAEAHRRCGIATALVEHLCALAAQRGSSTVYVQADSGDEPAKSLYGKLGTRKRVVHFEIDMESIGPLVHHPPPQRGQ
jgi:aminoglycoside 3-N-acetyltransferase I